MKKSLKKSTFLLDGPLLDCVKVSFPADVNFTQYPFSLNIIRHLPDIKFPTQVTFFVGENGSGKSTILEAIAAKAGFGQKAVAKIFILKHHKQTHTPAPKILLIV